MSAPEDAPPLFCRTREEGGTIVNVHVTPEALDALIRPFGGWPEWVLTAPYVGAAHPQASVVSDLDTGANCQRYAYAVLALFDRRVPPHRSSELWEDPMVLHPALSNAGQLDLALFNDSHDAWGAHVAVVLGDLLLHLCAEEGKPALWSWTDFSARPRYAHLVGLVRVPAGGERV